MQTEREYKTPSQGLHNLRFSSLQIAENFVWNFVHLQAQKNRRNKKKLSRSRAYVTRTSMVFIILDVITFSHTHTHIYIYDNNVESLFFCLRTRAHSLFSLFVY